MTWENDNCTPESKAFTGAIFVIVGGLLLFANLNFISLRPILAQWWPLILVVIGLKQLLFWRGPIAWAGGLFWMGTGALFLAGNLGYMQLRITSVLWPLVIIWFGVMMVFGSNGRGRKNSMHSGSDV